MDWPAVVCMHSHAGAWERGRSPPLFPRRRESITDQPIFNELTCRGLYAFPRGSVGTRKISPVIPAKHSPSFPRRQESITERPILNELTRRGLYAFPRGSVGTRKNKAPTGGAIISACPCCSCYFSRQPGRP